MTTATWTILPTPERELRLKQLGDEIAELAAHVDAATARLLELIREFDVREGWGNGFRSCAEWLTWRIGLAPGAAREHVRVARALATLPRLAKALAPRRALVLEGPGDHTGRDAGHRRAVAGRRPRRYRRTR